MPCFHPVEAYRSRFVNEKTGRRQITFRKSEAYVDLAPVHVPCGGCIGCRLERSRQWAIRCVHEASLHPVSWFVTLTYDDEHLPAGGSLDKTHFPAFMKRLRQWHVRAWRKQFKKGSLSRRSKAPRISYFHCGEYGDTTGRPHYHALIYGVTYPDLVAYKRTDHGQLFTSKTLDELWTHGQCMVGAVTFESAAYTSRYIMKKVTGDLAKKHYEHVDQVTGEIIQREPEYVTMSLKPAIGKGWIEQFASDVYPDDFVVIKGTKAKPPAYYDKQLQPDVLKEMKRKREARALVPKVRANNTPERLAVREAVKAARISTLKRNLE